MVSGAELRKRRVARGLPRLSEADRESRRRYERRRIAEKCAISDAEKLRRGCTDCGYSAHPEALDWDHLPRFEKLAGVSQLCNRPNVSNTRMLAEMEKCEVVCANCHRVRTANRRNGSTLGE